MPRLVDYADVVRQMTAGAMVCLYYNSGAFGFSPDVPTDSAGWIGQADATIRPAALALTRKVPAPVEETLAALAVRAWQERIGGSIWITPKSHWAYELDFGSHTWLPAALDSAGVSREQFALLCRRHDGTALEFEPAESKQVDEFVRRLLQNLFGSDFQLTWAGRPVICTVHHHKQLWWTSTEPGMMTRLNELISPIA